MNRVYAENVIEKIISAERSAAEIMMHAHNIIAESKTGRRDIVTEYDKRVQDYLMQVLSEAVPEARFFCEEQKEHDEPEGYYFSNPDPYLKPEPLPPDHPRHNCYFNEDGHLCVKNLSAFWLPEFTLQKEIGGTVYTVTGSYDGVETLDKKVERIMAEKFTEKMEDDQ